MAMHVVRSNSTPLWQSRQAFTKRVIDMVDIFIDQAKIDRGKDVTLYHNKSKRTQKPARSSYFDGWISAFHQPASRQSAYNELEPFVNTLLRNPTYFKLEEEPDDVDEVAA